MPTKPKTEFVIDRKKWYRGKGAAGSRLLRDDGTMCCLGQVGRQCGLKPKDIKGKGSPRRVESDKFPEWLTNGIENTDACLSAMQINDRIGIKDAYRERRLKAIFKKHGATLTFIN